MEGKRPSVAIGCIELHELNDDQQPTGRTMIFDGVELLPLTYSALQGMKLDGPVSIPLNWSAARLVHNDLIETPAEELASFHTHLESHYSSKAIGLVRGGWLPAGLALRDRMVVLPDRCTISALAAGYRGGIKTRPGNDFLDFFQDRSLTLHPGLFAMEGNQRKMPTSQQVADQWAEAKQKILAALPDAQVTPDTAVAGLIELLDEMREGMARKTAFLCEVAPKLCSPVSAVRRPEMWGWVLEVAKKFAVPREALVVLATLSIVSVSKGANPAKRLIKPAASYSSADAYNALADLRALEILMHLYAAFPQERLMLCTRDRDLSLFWAGIRASGFRLEGQTLTYTLSPVEELLPNLAPNLFVAYRSS
ncbi:hypothetical protein [Pseudomonas guariconensis]|uniref:hypothetical protein n=1 Tax=Pseudomonas guariconensis TaxID=1288410 RepID=UPI0039060E4F